ncbi:hypothetical protein PQX77_002927 [Marasmius sp. AFHP31]|nr:hypothetical protein PQX77_002927 [Marasmius sp. AFHP31]
MARNQPKRPSNSWMLFRADVVAEYHRRQITLPPQGKLSKIAAKMWKELDPAKKAQYEARAEAVKQTHSLVYPDYQYRPMKKEEKERLKEEKKAANSKNQGGRMVSTSLDAVAGPSHSQSTSSNFVPLIDTTSHNTGPANVDIEWSEMADEDDCLKYLTLTSNSDPHHNLQRPTLPNSQPAPGSWAFSHSASVEPNPVQSPYDLTEPSLQIYSPAPSDSSHSIPQCLNGTQEFGSSQGYDYPGLNELNFTPEMLQADPPPNVLLDVQYTIDFSTFSTSEWGALLADEE